MEKNVDLGHYVQTVPPDSFTGVYSKFSLPPGNNYDNNEHISRVPFHVKHAQLR